jgi:PEP-CTERM motif
LHFVSFVPFTILTSSGLSGTFNDNAIHDGNVTFTVENSPAGFANDVVLSAQVSSVPEPSSFLLLGLGLVSAGILAARRSSCRARVIQT